MLTIYRNLAVPLWSMTKYSKIHSCNKEIPSCNIIILYKVELHFVTSEFVYSIQVIILFDLFTLMFCQYMCFCLIQKVYFHIICLLIPSCNRKNNSCNTHFTTVTHVNQACMRKLFK